MSGRRSLALACAAALALLAAGGTARADWKPGLSNGHFPPGATIAGYDATGSFFYFCAATSGNGAALPGRVSEGLGGCRVEIDGRAVIERDRYHVYYQDPGAMYRWEASREGSVPAQAVTYHGLNQRYVCVAEATGDASGEARPGYLVPGQGCHTGGGHVAASAFVLHVAQDGGG